MAAPIARLTLILAATLATSAALAAQTTYDKTLNGPPGGQLTFESDVGSVSVAGGDTREVVVHADLEGSESLLNRLHISAEQTPSGVMVSARVDHDGWFDWFSWFDFGSVDARFTVQVPRDYPVDVRTSGGGLDIRGLNAAVHARTSGGSITLLLPQAARGSIDARTSGGGISCDFPITTTDLSRGNHVQGTIGGGGPPITLHTSGGSIHIERED